MSEYCREQHPLLCEEASEEEIYSPRYYRRVRPMNYKERRNNLKGAAAIFTRWPEHWSSFLTYWWIGIGMISLTTFIIYNSLFAFSMVSPADLKPARAVYIKENEKLSLKSASLPEVYMHVFVSKHEEIDLNQYLPYIEPVAYTFSDFKFNFIVVNNDTNMGWLSAEENNELALNMLMNKDISALKKETQSPNVYIEHVTLSTYMDNSPLKKYWRTLPHQLIEFLARTVSIWDKGGIAINPDIITPGYQHNLYIEKLQKILNKYAHTDKVISDSKLKNKLKAKSKKSRKLNNIRDIIEALESEDVSANAFSLQTLSEAENRIHVRNERKVTESLHHRNASASNKEYLDKPKTSHHKVNSVKHADEHNNGLNSSELTNSSEMSHETTKMSLLPLFLEYLFHNKADITPKPANETVTSSTHKNVIVSNSEESSSSKNTLERIENETKNIYKPVIISAAAIYNKSETNSATITPEITETENKLEANKLTIDVKGNIIATDTPCHAFLGTIYSNVIHHSEEETITDFIIAELTIFCKGLLSSCMGIELILL
ncbi:uncharacterized protein LOC142974896 isoform X2 [Anticarsia gemmatalis]